MDSTEIEQAFISDSKQVDCDGDGGADGHPKVYLNMGDQGQAVCPYCSRTFVWSGEPTGASEH